MAAKAYQARFLQAGGVIDHTPSGALDAGEVVVQNALVGVTREAIAASVAGTLIVAGIVEMVKITGTIAVGIALYWDTTGDPLGGSAGTGAATATSGGNSFVGFVVTAAGGTEQTVVVYMVPAIAVTNTGEVSAPITDPGASGAIPVTGSGYVPLVTATAETRTLAAPDGIGFQLLLYMKTDVGDCVVTCATTINETGNNTITFDATGQMILLIAVEEGSTIRWRVVNDDTGGLSTV